MDNVSLINAVLNSGLGVTNAVRPRQTQIDPLTDPNLLFTELLKQFGFGDFSVGTAGSPALTPFSSPLSDGLTGMTDWISQLIQLISSQAAPVMDTLAQTMPPLEGVVMSTPDVGVASPGAGAVAPASGNGDNNAGGSNEDGNRSIPASGGGTPGGSGSVPATGGATGANAVSFTGADGRSVILFNPALAPGFGGYFSQAVYDKLINDPVFAAEMLDRISNTHEVFTPDTGYGLVKNMGGETDPFAPQLATLFSSGHNYFGSETMDNGRVINYVPQVVKTERHRKLDRDTPYNQVTKVIYKADAGETLHMPASGYRNGVGPDGKEYSGMVISMDGNSIVINIGDRGTTAGYTMVLDNVTPVENLKVGSYVQTGEVIAIAKGDVGFSIQDNDDKINPLIAKDWYQYDVKPPAAGNVPAAAAPAANKQQVAAASTAPANNVQSGAPASGNTAAPKVNNQGNAASGNQFVSSANNQSGSANAGNASSAADTKKQTVPSGTGDQAGAASDKGEPASATTDKDKDKDVKSEDKKKPDVKKDKEMQAV